MYASLISHGYLLRNFETLFMALWNPRECIVMVLIIIEGWVIIRKTVLIKLRTLISAAAIFRIQVVASYISDVQVSMLRYVLSIRTMLISFPWSWKIGGNSTLRNISVVFYLFLVDTASSWMNSLVLLLTWTYQFTIILIMVWMLLFAIGLMSITLRQFLDFYWDDLRLIKLIMLCIMRNLFFFLNRVICL